MTLHCRCGWSGDSSDRVSATPEWIAENNVDYDHFANGNFNCPDCGESGGWLATGDDDVDVDYPYPDHDDEPGFMGDGVFDDMGEQAP